MDDAKGRGVDLRRSTVDLDFTCFNSMAGRNSLPTIVKSHKSKSAPLFRREHSGLCAPVRLALALAGLLVALPVLTVLHQDINLSSVATVITMVVRTVVITMIITTIIAMIIRMIVVMVVVVIVGMVVAAIIGMIVVRMVCIAVGITIAHRMATSVRSSDPSWAAAHGHECNI